MPAWLTDRMVAVGDGYLPEDTPAELSQLADPVVFLEGDEAPERPLPPFFLCVGTRDPILDDTRRLGAALERRGVTVETRYYEGEVHAFHAMAWRTQAKRCWRDTFAFLERHDTVEAQQPDNTRATPPTSATIQRLAPPLEPVHGTA